MPALVPAQEAPAPKPPTASEATPPRRRMPGLDLDGKPADRARAIVERALPKLGHRNWIAVVDSAYPEQVQPGMTIVYVGGDQAEIVDVVLKRLDEAKHVRPEVLVDAELARVSEEAAPGIEAYRTRLKAALGTREVQPVAHEKIIGEMGKAAESFRVLVLKTDLTLPYTSVFLRLDCAYWDAKREAELRKRLSDK